MTNYLASAKVQQFSITIASGSTTGTATINAVGSGAYIKYGGFNPSVSGNPSEAYAYLTLTNSTTITATRNNGTAGTVVITGAIIDGDTTNLIKSVQFGTATIASNSTSGTASISAVTNANAATHWLGQSDAGTAWLLSTDATRISLSGTTVTAARNSSVPVAIVVGFVIVEYQGTALNQAVQNISSNSGTGNISSWTATITSVTTANSVIDAAGFTVNAASGTQTVNPRTALTNSTTVTFTINTAGTATKIINCTVVEFAAGVLNSAVQRGTTTLTGVTSNTSSLSPSVTAANSGISFLGNTASASTSVLDQGQGAVALTNGTTVTTTKATATANITSSWEVFEVSTGASVVTIGFTGFGCGGIVNTTGSGTVGWASCG